MVPRTSILRGLAADRLLPSPPAAGLPLSPELTDRAGPQLCFLWRTKENYLFIIFFSPLKDLKKKKFAGRENEQKRGQQTPPQTFYKAQSRRNRVHQTAAGKGSFPRPPPVPQPKPRTAGRRRRKPEPKTAAEQARSRAARAGAPAAPLRPGFLPFLPSPFPPLRRWVRLPDTGASPPPAGAAHTLCRDKNLPGPPPPPRCDPPRSLGDPPIRQRSQNPRCSLKAGGRRRCPAVRDSPSKGGDDTINPPFILDSTRARGGSPSSYVLSPPEGAAEPRGSGMDAARVAARPGGHTPELRGLRRRARRALPGQG